MIGYTVLSEHELHIVKLPSEKTLKSGKQMASAIDVPGIMSAMSQTQQLFSLNL